MRAVRAVFVAVGLSMVVLACSSDAKSTTSASASSSSAAPEDERASAADVATGLKGIDAIGKAMVAAGTDKLTLQAASDQIEPIWEGIEGTVKANDPDTYLAFEDTFAVLDKAAEDGDAAAAKTGSDKISATVTAYLAKYPG